MSFIDEVSAQVATEGPDTFTFSDGTGGVWLAKRNQSQALFNLRESNGDLDWAVTLQLACFEVMAEEDVSAVRANLVALAAKCVIWADQIDDREFE